MIAGGSAERYLLLAEVVLLALLAVRARRDCPARPVRSTVSHA